MRENFWDLGACSKLNRRTMNYGHVGCGRTLDWVLIPGTPLFSMRMWKHPTKFWGLYLEQANVQLCWPNTTWERTLCPPQISLSFHISYAWYSLQDTRNLASFAFRIQTPH